MTATNAESMGGCSPDILIKGLNVMFCGINPAATAARDGHNFSHPSNRFWSVLHLAGFTDVRLQPDHERRLLTYGYGITALVTRPISQDVAITDAESHSVAAMFEAKIRATPPRR